MQRSEVKWPGLSEYRIGRMRPSNKVSSAIGKSRLHQPSLLWQSCILLELIHPSQECVIVRS